MPENGERNIRFGVYKNVCCGYEIVIPEGMDFPDCPNHSRLTTIWKPINTDIRKLAIAKPHSDTAA
jgi:hypothetical protein